MSVVGQVCDLTQEMLNARAQSNIRRATQSGRRPDLLQSPPRLVYEVISGTPHYSRNEATESGFHTVWRADGTSDSGIYARRLQNRESCGFQKTPLRCACATPRVHPSLSGFLTP